MKSLICSLVLLLSSATIAVGQVPTNRQSGTQMNFHNASLFEIVYSVARFMNKTVAVDGVSIPAVTWTGSVSTFNPRDSLNQALLGFGLQSDIQGAELHITAVTGRQTVPSGTSSYAVGVPAESPWMLNEAAKANPYQIYPSYPAHGFDGYTQPYSYDYGTTYGYGYGYIHPAALLEPCRNFPENRNCYMGKVKIDLKSALSWLKGTLKTLGYPESTPAIMYSTLVDDHNSPMAATDYEGPVDKHNNWFNNPYRIQAGRYLIQFKLDGRVLFEDYLRVRREYDTRSESQIVFVNQGKFRE
jgi:hypothetical protein